MMSEEEKEAIEYWKRDISLYHYNTQLCSEHYARIILNLIEKQQKEIERLKKDNKELDKECQALFEAYNFNDTNLLVKLLKEEE